MSFRRDGFWPAGDVSTNHCGCHALVRLEESRCHFEVLCPVVDCEGAQLERNWQDEEADGRQEGEDAQVPMRWKPAGTPTAEEVRAHRVSHLPFRDWCPECVAGRAEDWPHRARNSQETLTVPEVHLDYCFIREVAGEDYSVVLVGKDRGTKLILAISDSLGSAVMMCSRQIRSQPRLT